MLVNSASAAPDLFFISAFVVRLMIKFGWIQQVLRLPYQYNHVIASSITEYLEKADQSLKDETVAIFSRLLNDNTQTANTRLLSAYILLGLTGIKFT